MNASSSSSSLGSPDAVGESTSFPLGTYVAVMCVVHILVLLVIVILAGIEWRRAYVNAAERKRQCEEMEAKISRNAETLRFQERFCSIVNSPDVFGNMVDSPTLSVSHASPGSPRM